MIKETVVRPKQHTITVSFTYDELHVKQFESKFMELINLPGVDFEYHAEPQQLDITGKSALRIQTFERIEELEKKLPF